MKLFYYLLKLEESSFSGRSAVKPNHFNTHALKTMSISNKKQHQQNLAQDGNVNCVIQFLIFHTFDLRLQILSLSNVYGEKSRPIDSTLLLEYYLIKDVEPQSEIVTGMKELILQQMKELLNTPPMDDKKLTAQLEEMFGLVEISNQFELHPDIKRHLPIRIERKENE